MVQPLQWIKPHPVVTVMALWLWTILACGPLNQLPALSQPEQIPVTEAALVERGNYRLAAAFKKLSALPGYRLESQSIVRDSSGRQTELTVVGRHDASGNSYTLTQSSPSQETEIYYIAGHTYAFDSNYEGWVDRSAIPSSEAQQSLANLGQTGSLIQLLSQLGAILRQAGHGAISGRAATRYELQYGGAELIEMSGVSSPDVSGLIWVDDETGAPLKLEILLYEDKAPQPIQEFRLEVSQIGQIAPIVTPTPIVDPLAIVAATATAKTWAVLEARLNYEGELLRFELLPARVTQTPQATPLSAEMRLILRHLPTQLFQKANLEPFLAVLGQQLTLSIPQRNATIPSNRFHLEQSDAERRTVAVLYFFPADLENFNYVELVLSGSGNPDFIPVPVEGRD